MDLRGVGFKPWVNDEKAVHSVFDCLADDLIIKIFLHLNVEDICATRLVCRRFSALSPPGIEVSTSLQLQQALDLTPSRTVLLLPGTYEVFLPILSPTVIRGVGPSPSSVVLRLPSPLPNADAPERHTAHPPLGTQAAPLHDFYPQRSSSTTFSPLLVCAAPIRLSNLTLDCTGHSPSHPSSTNRRECVCVISGGKLFLQHVRIMSGLGLCLHVQGRTARLCASECELTVTDGSEGNVNMTTARGRAGVMVCGGGQVELVRTRVNSLRGECISVMAKVKVHVDTSAFCAAMCRRLGGSMRARTQLLGAYKTGGVPGLVAAVRGDVVEMGEAGHVAGSTRHLGTSLSPGKMTAFGGASDSDSDWKRGLCAGEHELAEWLVGEDVAYPAGNSGIRSLAIVTRCTLESNEVVCAVGPASHLDMTGCNFGPCSSAVELRAGTAQVKGCRFDRGGIQVCEQGTIELSRCELVGCGVKATECSVVVQDCSFHASGLLGQGQEQAGLDAEGGTVQVRCCTFDRAGVVLSGVEGTLDQNWMRGDQVSPTCAVRVQKARGKVEGSAGFGKDWQAPAGFVALTCNKILCGVEAAVVVAGAEVRLWKNVIRGAPGAGVVVCDAGTALVEENEVCDTGGCGVDVRGRAHGTVRLNTFYSNRGRGDGAVRVSDRGHGQVEQNNVSWATGVGVLVLLDNAVEAVVVDNKIWSSTVGVVVESPAGWDGEEFEDGTLLVEAHRGNLVRVEGNEFWENREGNVLVSDDCAHLVLRSNNVFYPSLPPPSPHSETTST